MYGEAPISVRCPTHGTISGLRVHLGQEVNAETLLLTLDAPQDQALLAEVIRERAWAEANIEAQLSSLNHKLKGEELAWRVDQGRAQAQALSVEVDIRRARGQLKTLERSIGAIEAQVKAGSLSLANFICLKSEISGLK
jgi:multidrug efflux pump subunit AcrA (membrane-fusion protein)